MGKNPNSFQKRQREMNKKRKAQDKLKRRQAQKDAAVNRDPATNLNADQQIDTTE
jgi:hypothetical protein